MNPEQQPPESQYSPFDTVGAPGEQVHVADTTPEGRQGYFDRALNGGKRNQVQAAELIPREGLGVRINTHENPVDPHAKLPRLSADINDPPAPTSTN